MIERLDHIALLTKDVERSTRFYSEWAAMSVIHQRQDSGSSHRVSWVRLAHDRSGLIIVLIESDQVGAEGRVDHFGFHVSSRADVDEIAGRARSAGILHDEPQYAGPIVGYFCTIKDPDGNLLEFSCEQFKVE